MSTQREVLEDHRDAIFGAIDTLVTDPDVSVDDAIALLRNVAASCTTSADSFLGAP